jgi:hypothetical protein
MLSFVDEVEVRASLCRWLGVLSWAVIAACQSAAPLAQPPHAQARTPLPTAAAQPVAVPALMRFGEPLGSEPFVDLAALLAQPSAHADHAVQVEGMVRQVCQRRGCWLELATGMDSGAPGCRVVLKGHAFFVPIDSAGSRARLTGTVQVQSIPAAQVAHMEGEGGRFPNKLPDGSASEVRIVASGVELARRSG